MRNALYEAVVSAIKNVERARGVLDEQHKRLQEASEIEYAARMELFKARKALEDNFRIDAGLEPLGEEYTGADVRFIQGK